MSRIDHTEFVAFDLETTGLSGTFCKIIEVGAVRFRGDGTELARMQVLVDPRCPVPAEATAVHGITDDMLRGKPIIEDVLPEFQEFLGGEDTLLMAHNASFDLGFLDMAFARAGIAAPEHQIIDTLQLSRKRLYLRNHRLETIGNHFGVVETTDHRALADALVVKEVFLRMLEERPRISTVNALCRSVQPMWFEPAEHVFVEVPPSIEPLGEAIESQQTITIIYEGGTKGRKKRRITPKGVIEDYGHLYLVAHCHIDGIEKHFRLDRVLHIEWE